VRLRSNILKHALVVTSVVLGLALLMFYVTFQLTTSSANRSLATQTDVYIDNTNKRSIMDIANMSDNWQRANNTKNFGLNADTLWMRVRIAPDISQQQRLIEINYALLDHVDLWFFEDIGHDASDDVSISTLLQHDATGDKHVFSQRPILHDTFIFLLPNTDSELVVYAKVNTSGALKAQFSLWDQSSYVSYVSAHRLFMGLFFGYMIAMGLSNLFLYVTTKVPSFIVYSAYVSVFALVIASLHGISFRFLWPQSIWLQERGLVILGYSMMVFVVLFSGLILNLKVHNRLFSNILRLTHIFYLTGLVFSFVIGYSVMVKLLLLSLIITMPVLVGMSSWIAYNGSQIAKYYTVALCVLLISGLSVSADNFGWIDLPIDSSYFLILGAIVQTLLLAFVLAKSFDDQREEVNNAQTKLLASEKAIANAKDELLHVQQAAQEQLEYRVDERTLELEIALRELSDVNTELERLSSIDPLTGLVNRRAFDKRILAEARRSRRERTPLAIAMLDIDHFKQVNDTYGHQAGDACLKHFAKLMRGTIKRPSDVLCRYGGEEFVVILPNTTLDGAKNVIDTLRIAVQDSVIEFEGKTITLTVSAGVTARVVASDSDDELMVSYADKQLYAAKQSGRNKVVAANF